MKRRPDASRTGGYMFRRSLRHRLDDVHRALTAVRTAVRRINAHYANQQRPPDPHYPPLILSSLDFHLWTSQNSLALLEVGVAAGRSPQRPIMDLLRSFQLLDKEQTELDGQLKLRLRRSGGRKSPLHELHKPVHRLGVAIDRLQGPQTKFQRQLEKLRKKCNLTVYGLAALADVDPTYVRRLINGERRNPGRFVVIRLAEAMEEYSSAISSRDVNRLIRYGGHRPLKKREKGR